MEVQLHMNKTEKAARGAGTPGRQMETAALSETTISQSNYTRTGEPKQGFVESLLPQGVANALSSRELVQLTGFRSVRELQAEIAREREAGALILSTCRNGGGYFIPSDGVEGTREMCAFVATLRARAFHTLKALKTAREVLQHIDGQLDLYDLEESVTVHEPPETLLPEKTV